MPRAKDQMRAAGHAPLHRARDVGARRRRAAARKRAGKTWSAERRRRGQPAAGASTYAAMRGLLAMIGAAAAAGALCASCGGARYEPQPGGEALPALVPAAAAVARQSQGPRPLFLDTRPAAGYAAGHVAGAVSMPLETFQPLPDDTLDQLFEDRVAGILFAAGIRGDQETVAVDDGGIDGFRRASTVCWILSLAGFDRCRVLNGGLPAWRAASGPVDAGRVKPPKRDEKEKAPSLAQRPPALASLEMFRFATASGDAVFVDSSAGDGPAGVRGAVRLPLERFAAAGSIDVRALDDALDRAQLRAESEAIAFGEHLTDGAAGWFVLARHCAIPTVRLYPGGMAAARRAPTLPPAALAPHPVEDRRKK